MKYLPTLSLGLLLGCGEKEKPVFEDYGIPNPTLILCNNSVDLCNAWDMDGDRKIDCLVKASVPNKILSYDIKHKDNCRGSFDPYFSVPMSPRLKETLSIIVDERRNFEYFTDLDGYNHNLE